MEKRLDNYCKSEKYFTATLLSYLFINDEFKGLKKFLGFLNEISCYPIYFSNETRPMDIKKILLTSEIHFVTEMNVERDLIANNFSINPKAFSRKKEKQVVPDVIAIIEDIILIIEAKYYTNFYEHSIYEQLEQQKYIFDVLKDFYDNYDMGELHICICPDKIRVYNGYIITWHQIYDLFKDAKNCQFVMRQIGINVNRNQRY